jgi:D-alanyl-D-alanine carboxypeptidase
VLTTLIALEQLDPDTPIVVSTNAALAPPSKLGLRPGEIVAARDLLYGIMLKSGNDASTAMAEAIGGSVERFAAMMNMRARQLGAVNTHFRNPHGLPDEDHYSTAYDLAVIFRQAMTNLRFAKITGTRTSSVAIQSAGPVRAKLIQVNNHNRLLGTYYGMLGGKTGYTRAAKRCFVGQAERGNTSLIVAVLGSGDLWGDTQRLFEYGFEQSGEYTLPRMDIVSTRVAIPVHRANHRVYSQARPVKVATKVRSQANRQAKVSSKPRTVKVAAKGAATKVRSKASHRAKVSPRAKAVEARVSAKRASVKTVKSKANRQAQVSSQVKPVNVSGKKAKPAAAQATKVSRGKQTSRPKLVSKPSTRAVSSKVKRAKAQIAQAS